MKRHEDAPLDAEERALAAQLRRLPPHGEPAPDLDARILAMARTAGSPRRPTPWYRSLPGYASAAAICVLAAGLAWQLWPLHAQRGGIRPATKVAPPPPPAAAAAAPQGTSATAQDSNSDQTTEAETKADADAAAPTREATPSPPQAERPAPVRIVTPAPQPPSISAANDVSSDSVPAVAASKVVAPPPTPPAPPAPPAPPPPAAAQTTDASPPAAAPAESGVKPREQPKSAPVTVNAMRARTADDTENGYDARPPATVQDASVRNDWLKRIRELMAQGDREGARSSLQEYRARYPDAAIPADLQSLLAPPPSKTP